LAYRADSNSAAREGLWVRVPPAVPDSLDDGIRCFAEPQDNAGCVDGRGLGPAYAYLLGLYLGDGMLSIGRRHVWRLRISLDASYPHIIARGQRAIAEVSGRRVGAVARPGCVEISGYWKHWICLFPQHGRGQKHERRIRLERWQRALVVAHPGDFIAGLIHSDGCRVLNQVKGRAYPRYFFSNLAADIRELFSWACRLVGVDSRAAGPRNVAVSRRASVAILDQMVGPKA
jgi:hypothetical protein